MNLAQVFEAPKRVRSPAAGATSSAADHHAGIAVWVWGGVAAAVSATGSWVPSLWGDEVATITSAELSWSQLAALLRHVDAVHGLFYGLMHLWIGLFGASAFAVRLPSALAVGAATSAVYLLGRRIDTGRYAHLAALVFCLMPRVTYMGTEARSPALQTAAVAWLAILAVRLDHRDSGIRAGALHGALVGLTATLDINALLAAPALVIFLAHHGARRRRRAAASLFTAIVTALPVALASFRERAQNDYLAHQPAPCVETFLGGQWWGPTPLLAYTALAVSIVGVGLLAASRTRRAPALIVWAAAPTGFLMLVTVFVRATYAERYVSLSSPAVALVTAYALHRAATSRRLLQLAASLAVVVALAPVWFMQRTPLAKHRGADWQLVSALISRGAQPGDGILFDESVSRSHRPRLAEYAYPAAFTGVKDLEVRIPHQERAELSDSTVPLAQRTNALETTRRVWIVAASPHGTDADRRTLQANGFERLHAWSFGTDRVLLYERRP